MLIRPCLPDFSGLRNFSTVRNQFAHLQFRRFSTGCPG